MDHNSNILGIKHNIRIDAATIKNVLWFCVFSLIQCIGHLSQAHINPAVTVGAVILGKKTISEALVYFVSQMIGAILGYGMLKVGKSKSNYSFIELITTNYVQI